LLVSGGRDGSVRVWEVGSGRELRVLTGQQGWVRSVGFSPDGALLVSGGDDGSVRVWEVGSGRELRVLTGHQDWVRSVGFSPDGALLVSGGDDGSVRVWEVGSGRELRVLTGHQGWVFSVGFSPDGALLVSGGQDGSVRVWETTTGRPIAALLGLPAGWAALLPDGYKLVGDPGGAFWWTIKAVRFEPGELDRFDPSARRLPDDAPLPLPPEYRIVTPGMRPVAARPPWEPQPRRLRLRRRRTGT
ncbi:WD40 repeat domain-containing protein, partial [Frankia sp. QA3]|uniref:WD40 repeat domain-containing protein n=1 Tax=Frankia sp. QA3 TaxID=710111 RepID=UPI000269C903